MNEGETCGKACDACGTVCEERQSPPNFQEKPNALSRVRHVIAVMSGKGGVGKSFVTALAASMMRRAGYHVGILDADVTGPSIPKMFGVSGQIRGTASGAYPLPSDGGIDIMSVNLMLKNEEEPVVWRGPVISGVVKQFWSEIIWQDVDYSLWICRRGLGTFP